MNDSEKIKMHLNIGDQRLAVSVPFDRQEFARQTEAAVDSLYRKWRREFAAKSDREILTMVAYQYATFYGELKERYESASEKAEECLRQFGRQADTEPKP